MTNTTISCLKTEKNKKILAYDGTYVTDFNYHSIDSIVPKLFALMEEKQAKELKEIQGEQKEIAWGSQIRSYVLHPYSLVKDNRSLYESNNPKDVLDGHLDDFIYAYLKSSIQEENHEE